jgi:putative hydrolase of the HAD superfamily
MVVSIGFDKIDFAGVKGILLDMDNTLYAYQPCHEYALKQCYLVFSKIKEDLTYDGFIELYQKSRHRINTDLRHQGASHSRLLYFQKFFEMVYAKSCYALTMEYEDLYWNSFFEKMTLDTSAFQFLTRAAGNNITICIITDLTARVQFEKIQKLGLENMVRWIVSSEEAGVEKPHPYVYKLAMEKLNMAPKDLIAIGDDIKKDIHGASTLGIKNYLIEWKHPVS